MECSASLRLPPEGVGWIEGRAPVMLEHDPPVQVGLGGRAGSVVGTQRTGERYPIPASSTLFSEPGVLVAGVFLATSPGCQPSPVALLGMGSLIGQMRLGHNCELAIRDAGRR